VTHSPRERPLCADPRQRLHEVHVEAATLRRRLPARWRFGTVGWMSPGYVGEVWPEPRTHADLARDGLVQYAAHPLLGAVLWELGEDGADLDRDLQQVAASLPPSLQLVVRAPLAFTTPRFTDEGTRAGAGRANPRFLDARVLGRDVLGPLASALGAQLAVVVLAFPAALHLAGIEPPAFAERLAGFLTALGTHVTLAVSVNEPAYLTLELARTLALQPASPVLVAGPGMPPLEAQAALVPSGPLVVVRARASQATAVASFVARAPELPTYVLVEDDGGASAPGAIFAIARELASREE